MIDSIFLGWFNCSTLKKCCGLPLWLLLVHSWRNPNEHTFYPVFAEDIYTYGSGESLWQHWIFNGEWLTISHCHDMTLTLSKNAWCLSNHWGLDHSPPSWFVSCFHRKPCLVINGYYSNGKKKTSHATLWSKGEELLSLFFKYEELWVSHHK